MSDYDDRMAQLRLRFLERMAEEVDEIEALARDHSGGPELSDRVHKLAGIAGVMGFADVSHEAKLLDRQLPQAEDAATLAQPLIAAMRAALARPQG